MTGKLVVMASGSGTNLQAIIRAVEEGRLNAEIVGVIVNRRNARARERALRAGLPVDFRPLSPYLHTGVGGEPSGGHAQASGSASPGSASPGSASPGSASPGDLTDASRSGAADEEPRSDRTTGVAVGPVACDGPGPEDWSRSPGRCRYDADLAEAVSKYTPDLVILAGWMHLLSSAFLNRFPDRVLNLHPALPGRFPGASAIDDAWAAYLAGCIKRTGVMVHYVPDHGIDSGPVIVSEPVPIHPDDTVDTLRARIHGVEHRLIVQAIAAVLAGSTDPTDPIECRHAANQREHAAELSH